MSPNVRWYICFYVSSGFIVDAQWFQNMSSGLTFGEPLHLGSSVSFYQFFYGVMEPRCLETFIRSGDRDPQSLLVGFPDHDVDSFLFFSFKV